MLLLLSGVATFVITLSGLGFDVGVWATVPPFASPRDVCDSRLSAVAPLARCSEPSQAECARLSTCKTVVRGVCVCAHNLWPRLPQAGELPPRALATRSHWTRLFLGLRRCCIQAGTRFRATRVSCGVSTNRHGGESAYDFPCESFFCAALCSDLRYTALMLRSGHRREQLRANKHTCVHGSSRRARLKVQRVGIINDVIWVD